MSDKEDMVWIIVLSMLIIAMLIFCGVTKAKQQRLIKTYIVDRQCKFMSAPDDRGAWAICEDGSMWNVSPLETESPH